MLCGRNGDTHFRGKRSLLSRSSGGAFNLSPLKRHAAGRLADLPRRVLVRVKVPGDSESLPGRHVPQQGAVRTRGHFPNDRAAAKLIYLAMRGVEGKWRAPPQFGHAARIEFAMHFRERFAMVAACVPAPCFLPGAGMAGTAVRHRRAKRERVRAFQMRKVAIVRVGGPRQAPPRVAFKRNF